MNWRINPVGCLLLSRLRQLLGANECVSGAGRGSRKTSTARRRHRELRSVIEALPEIHRATRRPRVRHTTGSVGETTGRIMWRLTAIASQASLSAGKWCVNATSSPVLLGAWPSARKWGCEAWDWMRQDVLVAQRRLSAMLPAVRAWRPGKLQLEWRELIAKPTVIAAAAIFVLVCGSLLMTPVASRAILSPPGELAGSIRDLPWITAGGPAFINQESVLAAQGMPHMLAYGSVSRGFDSDTLVLQRELRDQEEETIIAAKNGPVKSVGGIASITHPVTVGPAGISSMFSYAESYIGTRYVWGGTTPSPGFDCSGFTQHVFHHLGINLRRTSQEQYLEGAPIPESNLQPGDLVFFSTYTYGASHVGIYIGSGLMVDSEVSGVIIDNIANRYWAPRYLGARRIAKI